MIQRGVHSPCIGSQSLLFKQFMLLQGKLQPSPKYPSSHSKNPSQGIFTISNSILIKKSSRNYNIDNSM